MHKRKQGEALLMRLEMLENDGRISLHNPSKQKKGKWKEAEHNCP